MNLRTFCVIMMGIAVFHIGCDRHIDSDSDRLKAANRLPQGMVSLPFFDRPSTKVDVAAAESYLEPLDADSVEMFTYRRDTIYHPVNLSHRCQVFIATYARTFNAKYLDRAERYAKKLISLRHISGDAAYLPYDLRYAVHSDSANTLTPPWYSGMAQGEFLTVKVRLHEFTGNEDYLKVARSVFESFLRPRASNEKWVVRLDSNNFYWIEEYPHEEHPGMTLNGFIGAVFGIHEYFQATGDPRARTVYDMAVTTLKHYIPYYLQDGQTSLYCLGHGKEASLGYHRLHIRQMHELHRLSGDPFFQEMAKAFEARVTVDSSGR